MKILWILGMAAMLALGTVACSERSSVSYKDNVQKSLEQADLKGVSVSEDNAKNTITLSGTLHSAEAKRQAGMVAQSAAASRTIVNEIGVEPVGVESEAKDIASNVDEAIEKNYEASLISGRLDKQDISYDAKNGVLTLKGSVKTPQQKREAEQLASNVPNVQQVLNQIEVKR